MLVLGAFLLTGSTSAGLVSSDNDHRITYSFGNEVEGRIIAECGIFVLTEDYDYNVTTTIFLDKQGTPYRSVSRAEFDGVISNSSSGATFDHFARSRTDLDYATGELTVAGLTSLIIVPGQASLIGADAQWPPLPNEATLCATLA